MKLLLFFVFSFSVTLSTTSACDTAFAVCPDALCFLDEPLAGHLSSNRWGWSNRIDDTSTPLVCDLYVGAAECNLSKGRLVGTVAVQDDIVVYTLHQDAHLLLTATHVYLGSENLPRDRRGRHNVTPGQYPFQTDFDQPSLGGVVTVDGFEEGHYFIGHAEVCDFPSTSPSLLPTASPSRTPTKIPTVTPSATPSLRAVAAQQSDTPSVEVVEVFDDPVLPPNEPDQFFPVLTLDEPTPAPNPTTLFPFLVPPPTPDTPPPTTAENVCSGESAFATCDFATRCFDERFAGNQRWGWSNGIVFNELCKLYANAAHCDLSKADLVGYVRVDTLNDRLQITMEDEYTLAELHVHVGVDEFPVAPNGKDMIAPGLYPYQYDFDEPGVYRASLHLGEQVMDQSNFMIVHAKVCRVV